MVKDLLIILQLSIDIIPVTKKAVQKTKYINIISPVSLFLETQEYSELLSSLTDTPPGAKPA